MPAQQQRGTFICKIGEFHEPESSSHDFSTSNKLTAEESHEIG